MPADPTENIRRQATATINANPKTRAELIAAYGAENVWNTDELSAEFEVHGFMAPMAIVTRLSDNKRGTVMFQHHPRFYFDFNEVLP